MELRLQQYSEHIFLRVCSRIEPRVDIPLHGVRDSAQQRWADEMHILGGGRVANPYPANFFPWWRRQIVAIDDYPYAGIYFQGDSDMPLPPGSAYGDIGNESQPPFFKKKKLIYLIFFCFLDYVKPKRHVFG